MFCTFSLQNVLFATAACILSTSELQKGLSDPQFFNIFTSKCTFHHSGVHFFDIWTYKSAPGPPVFFKHFHFHMFVSPQRRAFFRHLNLQKCSEHLMFCAFPLGNVLFATAACNFWFLLWPHDSAPAALTGLLLDWPDTQIIEKTQHFATSLTFGADVSSFSWLSRYCIFFLPTWLPVSSAFQLSILSEVCYLNFLRIYIYLNTYVYIYYVTYIYISCVSLMAQLKSETTGTAHHAILACMKRQEATIEAWREFSAPCRLRHGCLYFTRLITSIEIKDMHYKLKGKDVKARFAIFCEYPMISNWYPRSSRLLRKHWKRPWSPMVCPELGHELHRVASLIWCANHLAASYTSQNQCMVRPCSSNYI